MARRNRTCCADSINHLEHISCYYALGPAHQTGLNGAGLVCVGLDSSLKHLLQLPCAHVLGQLVGGEGPPGPSCLHLLHRGLVGATTGQLLLLVAAHCNSTNCPGQHPISGCTPSVGGLYIAVQAALGAVQHQQSAIHTCCQHHLDKWLVQLVW